VTSTEFFCQEPGCRERGNLDPKNRPRRLRIKAVNLSTNRDPSVVRTHVRTCDHVTQLRTSAN